MDIEENYSGHMVGRYSLIEKLGTGHFGAVYKAHDIVLDSLKAIKIMNVPDPTRAYKLFEEASIPYKCTHANIVSINGGSLEQFEGSIHFIIDMELVSGGSLEDLISKDDVSVLDALGIIKTMLFGLQHSHNQGIVHRDIKPANILLANGIPKLSDFGLATALNTILPMNELWYCSHAAPEVRNTPTPIVTAEADIFAVGITMFRAVNRITNWAAFLQSTKKAEQLLNSGTLVEKAHFNPYIPSRVSRVVRKACKANPANRFHSAAEMRDAIEKLLPGIDWRQTEDLSWTGTDKKQEFRTEIVSKRTGYDFLIKINGRRDVSKCKKFSDLDEAINHMQTHIAQTTLK